MRRFKSDPRDKAPIEIENPRRYMTITYVASLAVIAALSIVVHLMLDKVIEEQSKTGNIVNMSGQQRMLSQRTAMFTLEYLRFGREEDKQLAQESLERMRANHETLLSGHKAAVAQGQASPLSPAMQDMYFFEPLNVNNKLVQFERLVGEALDMSRPREQYGAAYESDAFFELAKAPLLNALHQVVVQYERESIEKVNDLRFAQEVVLAIIIITILVEGFLIFRPMVSKVSLYAQRLQREANFDPLSGLHNRRAFYLIGNKTFASSMRYQRPMSIVLADVDHFKRINDEYGHDVGDMAIKHVADILMETCRTADTVCRFGGEEYLVLLPNTNEKDAYIAAEKIRHAIETSPLQVNGTSIPMTISVGIAEFSTAFANIDNQIKLADEALFRAKQTGRNNVMTASLLSKL